MHVYTLVRCNVKGEGDADDNNRFIGTCKKTMESLSVGRSIYVDFRRRRRYARAVYADSCCPYYLRLYSIYMLQGVR